MRWFLRSSVCAVILAFAGNALAEEAKPEFVFAFHGFLGGSLYTQDSGLIGPSNGENALYVLRQPNEHKLVFGGDVRQNRLNFSLAGPKVFGGAIPKGVAEIDFFGASQGPGSFGDVSVFPRLRLAFAELNWNNTTFLRVGQDFELLVGAGPGPVATPPLFPASVGHIANPLTFFAGELGWREPGIAAYHNIPVAEGHWVEVAASVQRSQWQAPQVNAACSVAATNAAPQNTSTCAAANSTILIPDWSTAPLSSGEYSGWPGVEARVRFASKMYQFVLVGHWNRVHRAGFDNNASQTGTGIVNGVSATDLDVFAGQAIVKVNYGPLTVLGGGYAGENTTPLTGDINQYQPNSVGAIHEWGAFGNVGYNFTKELSAWALVGTAHPYYADILNGNKTAGTNALTRLQNTMFSGMLRYQEGGFAWGLEWTHWLTRTVVSGKTPATNPNGYRSAPNGDLDANQLMLSGFYFF